jgi:hypothetical protein
MNKSKTPVRLAKPAAGAPVLTDQQKAEQVARFFTQKRQELFNGLLFNLTHGAATLGTGFDIKGLVDKALEGADYAIERLFPLPTEKEDAK